ncbi:unnamed protein product [Bursaphelenchus xylophilus]|uniref:(pine wood nematode) hypothetical protein n=1 Tax=Bursaphelenchus xylophilus TaxID=6326 RepID=A0A1I7S8F8_BURXY|nr:unnamed protein product [Bursaphelenchus xylophilus]CAG9121047.1 unnamed protein product [Bursaphelenchus xylophilus]
MLKRLFLITILVVEVINADAGQKGHKFGSKDEIADVDHIKHHLGQQIDMENEKMSEEKQRFHYFNMHDLNKDGFIDGLELMGAIFHNDDEDGTGFGRAIPDEDIERMIDPVLEEMDGDKDGLIDFPEYFKVANG